MPQLRVGLAQVDLTVGDLAGNAEAIVRWTAQARRQGCHLVAFPEMALVGYPVEDLALRHAFVAASQQALPTLAARLAAQGLGDVAVVVGYLDAAPESPSGPGRPAGGPTNAAAMLHGGRVVARYAKHQLPNYGVFDEFRYFVHGDRLPVVRLHGVDVALTICEDLWQDGGPVVAARTANAGLLVCINGSPYERGKIADRVALVQRRAVEAAAAVAYVNLVGGQDELVFDGGSFAVDAAGVVRARAPQFAEGVMAVDLDLPQAWDDRVGAVDAEDRTWIVVERATVSTTPVPRYPAIPPGVAPTMPDEAEVYAALVLGTRDYVRKNGFRTVVVGLSGGIDSALVATVAVDALGKDAVRAVSMPSVYSSEGSRSDAADLSARQGIELSTISIAPIMAAYEGSVVLHGLARENLQARIRGNLLMGLSNERGDLVLTTGNKSELATGFSTLYGDSAGGFAPIKDVPKTFVYALARWRNAQAQAAGQVPPIPEPSITKPPSAELAPGQLDADRLPEYAVLDEVLAAYVDGDLDRAAMIAAGHDPAVVDRVVTLVDVAEYKRRQYPPGPKISLKAFGRDRRLPITNRWRFQAASGEGHPVAGPAPNAAVPAAAVPPVTDPAAAAARRPRVLVVQHSPTEGPALLGRALDAAVVEVDVVHTYRGDPVPDRVDADGLVVLGGAMGAYDDERAPWLPATRDLLAGAAADGVPVLGICLGGQLLAVATGGRVVTGDRPEIGVDDVTVLPQAAGDPLLGALAGQTVPVVQWHRDTFVDLPPGAVLLAGSAGYPHQAYRLGEVAWGLQFHPECDAELLRAWVADAPEDPRDAGREPADVADEIGRREGELAGVWVPVLGAFADVVKRR